MTADFSQDRRFHDDRGKIPAEGDRRHAHHAIEGPLPPPPRPAHPLPDPSDWSFELL